MLQSIFDAEWQRPRECRSPSAPLCWVGPPPPPVTRLEGDRFHLAIAPTALVLSRLAAWRAGRRVPRPLPPSIERWATARPAVVLTQPQRGTQRLLFVGRTGGRARLAAGDRQGIGDCGWASGAAHSHLAKYRHARYREGLYSDTTASANEPLATGSLGKGPHTAHTGHALRLWPDGNRQRTAAEGKAMVPAPRGWAICSMSGPPMCWMIQPGRDPPCIVGLEIKVQRLSTTPQRLANNCPTTPQRLSNDSGWGPISDSCAVMLIVCSRANAFFLKKLGNNLADRPACSRKRRFRPQQFAPRNCVSSGLLSLHHPKRLAALRTAIAFPQSGRRLPALHKKLRRQHLTEGAELQNDHVAYAVGIDNLPTVSSPCSWSTTATHAVMQSTLIDDWIMETLSRHGDWLRVALDSWGFSLYQLVGQPVKCKPPTLAVSPAVLPQFFHKSTPLRRALRRGFRNFLQEKRVCA